MRKFALAIALCLPLLPACEQQKWEETKMFHDVPKKAHATHPETAPAAPEKAAH